VHSHKHNLDEQFLQFSPLGFVSLGHFTVPRFFCVYVCVFLGYIVVLHMCCVIVTWWSGPGGIEAYSLGPSFSALTLLVGSFHP